MHFLAAGSLALAAGVVFGIFGAGGSILLVPILVYVLDVPIKEALGMALLILTLTAGLATAAHARSGNVIWWIGLRWAALGMVGAYVGGRVAELIPPHVLLTTFATVVVIASLAMIRRPTPSPHTPPSLPMGRVVSVGLVLGFFTGMIGVGGGFLLVPALVLVCGIDIKRAIGTSLFIICVNSFGGFLGFAAHESFDWRLTASVTAFAAAGSLIGERLGKPLPGHRLRPAFGVFLLIVGAAMVIENVIEMFSHPH